MWAGQRLKVWRWQGSGLFGLVAVEADKDGARIKEVRTKEEGIVKLRVALFSWLLVVKVSESFGDSSSALSDHDPSS